MIPPLGKIVILATDHKQGHRKTVGEINLDLSATRVQPVGKDGNSVTLKHVHQIMLHVARPVVQVRTVSLGAAIVAVLVTVTENNSEGIDRLVVKVSNKLCCHLEVAYVDLLFEVADLAAKV
jgi:hypothetical protein